MIRKWLILRNTIEHIPSHSDLGKWNSFDMSNKTISVTQEGPANALALNKDFSQVVIAGRNGELLEEFTNHAKSLA